MAWTRLAVLLCVSALPAQRELLDTLPADREVARNWLVTMGPALLAVDLPGRGSPRGFATCGERLWLARGGRLYGLTALEHAPVVDVPTPAGMRSLCSDGRFLYGLVNGAVVLLDPLAGQEVRRLPIEFERIAGERAPKLLVAASPGQLQLWTNLRVVGLNVAEADSRVLGPVPAPLRTTHWLVRRGDLWYRGDADGVFRLAAVPYVGASIEAEQPAPPPGRSVPNPRGTSWPIRGVRTSSATSWDGQLLVAFERADKGHVGELVAGLLRPEASRPVERLTVAIHAQGAGKGCRWSVGPKPLYSLAKVALELRRIARDPSSMVVQADGSAALMGVVIEPHRGVCNGDVAATWDAAIAAGFAAVSCPGIEGWVRRQQERQQRSQQKGQ